jgi:hypothetical protein
MRHVGRILVEFAALGQHRLIASIGNDDASCGRMKSSVLVTHLQRASPLRFPRAYHRRAVRVLDLEPIP